MIEDILDRGKHDYFSLPTKVVKLEGSMNFPQELTFELVTVLASRSLPDFDL